MENSFKDKVLILYRKTVRKHKWLKYPMMGLSIVLLFFERVGLYIKAHTRKYVSSMIVFLFAFVSCSFSSVIWGNDQGSFANSQETFYAETEESNASLAIETEVNADNIEFTEEGVVDDLELVKGEDVSNVDTVSGAEVLDHIDMTQYEKEDEQPSNDKDTGEVSFNRNDWQLVLVNKSHPIADDYEFELGTISGSMQCDARILGDLYSMIEGAYNDNINLVICSPYRADSRQEMLFDRKVNKYMAQGMSYMDSYRLASQAVTIPGTSEHQIGMALDIICNGYSNLDEGFGDTEAGKWLAEHAHEYGFVVRYLEGKEDITGIEYEPWHIRYVGVNAATIMHDENITLEEFWEKYL